MALKTCVSCQGEFTEFSFPFNGMKCKKCHELEPVSDSVETSTSVIQSESESSIARTEKISNHPKQDGKKISPLKVGLISLFAIIGCIFVYRADAENERQRKSIEVSEGIRVRDAKVTINEMTKEIYEYIKRIDDLNKKRASYNGLDSTIPTIGRDGEFQLAENAVNNINNEIDKLVSSSGSTIKRIEQFAIDNKIDADPALVQHISTIKRSIATAVNREDPEENRPNPGSTDIAILVASAAQLRQTISSLPKVVPDGDPRYNAIVTENTPRAVGPSAQLFNDRCYAFEKRFGKKNLKLVAASNGFSNLLP